jgi:hypothetical protein
VAGRWRQRDAGFACLREADGDRLFRRARTVLPLADVMDFLAHELSSLGARRFALAGIGTRAFLRRLVGHDDSLERAFRVASMEAPVVARQSLRTESAAGKR